MAFFAAPPMSVAPPTSTSRYRKRVPSIPPTHLDSRPITVATSSSSNPATRLACPAAEVLDQTDDEGRTLFDRCIRHARSVSATTTIDTAATTTTATPDSASRYRRTPEILVELVAAYYRSTTNQTSIKNKIRHHFKCHPKLVNVPIAFTPGIFQTVLHRAIEQDAICSGSFLARFICTICPNAQLSPYPLSRLDDISASIPPIDSLFHQAIRIQSPPCLDWLLSRYEHGESIDPCLMHYAIEKTYTDTVLQVQFCELLYAHQSNFRARYIRIDFLNAINPRGETPLSLAIRMQQWAVLNWLLRFVGGDLQLVTSDLQGYGPIHRVCLDRSKERRAFQALYAAGIHRFPSEFWNQPQASIHATALHLAFACADLYSLCFLLACPLVRTDMVDAEGNTIEHLAARHRDFRIMLLALHRNKFRIGIANYAGQYSTQIAFEHGCYLTAILSRLHSPTGQLRPTNATASVFTGKSLSNSLRFVRATRSNPHLMENIKLVFRESKQQASENPIRWTNPRDIQSWLETWDVQSYLQSIDYVIDQAEFTEPSSEETVSNVSLGSTTVNTSADPDTITQPQTNKCFSHLPPSPPSPPPTFWEAPPPPPPVCWEAPPTSLPAPPSPPTSHPRPATTTSPPLQSNMLSPSTLPPPLLLDVIPTAYFRAAMEQCSKSLGDYANYIRTTSSRTATTLANFEHSTASPTNVEFEKTTEPATTEPATTEPATTEPATTEPATTEPATIDPATTDPATTEPATTEPATTEPATIEPATTAVSEDTLDSGTVIDVFAPEYPTDDETEDEMEIAPHQTSLSWAKYSEAVYVDLTEQDTQAQKVEDEQEEPEDEAEEEEEEDSDASSWRIASDTEEDTDCDTEE